MMDVMIVTEHEAKQSLNRYRRTKSHTDLADVLAFLMRSQSEIKKQQDEILRRVR